MDLKHLKRIRINEDLNMLAVPRYSVKIVKVKKVDPSVSKKKLITVDEKKIDLIDFVTILY